MKRKQIQSENEDFFGRAEIKPSPEEFLQTSTQRYQEEEPFREMVHAYLDLNRIERAKLSICRRLAPKTYREATQKIVEQYIETESPLKRPFLTPQRKFATAMVSTVAAIGMAGYITFFHGKRDVLAAEVVEEQTDTYIECGMEYKWGEEKKIFKMECFPRQKIASEQFPARVLSDCNFPGADSHYEKNNGLWDFEMATYLGPNAVERAKKDFDDCGVEGIILSGGEWEAMPIGGTYPIADAVSPFTLDRITEDEVEKLAFHFQGQTVAAVKTGLYDKTTMRRDSYFER